MSSTVDEEDSSRSTAPWVSDFMQRCLSSSKSSNDAVSDGCDVPAPLLREWVKLQLTRGTWKDALSAAVSITDATECFHQMIREIGGEEHLNAEQAGWVDDIRRRFSKKLECCGDAALAAQRHDEATSEYSAALSLDPTSPDLFIKRSKTYLAKGSWKDALNDADEVINLDPSSPWGYERRHAALHKGRNYDDAIAAFETMLSKMAHSSDPEIRRHHLDYITPAKTRAAIRGVVQDAIRDLPRVLINTDTGRLIDKSKQAAMFETLPVFKEMLSSMTMDINQNRIEQEVTQYYRYATFSHRWEENEPLFDKVIHIVVCDLEESPTHDKLRMFCKIVQAAGFHWAWSDTCCINKGDNVVLQEALVSMFKWYEGSSLTIVYLSDVHSPSRRGDLMKSIWNTRAWTFQEYHASKVVRFYTEDWVPYLNLDIPNHKDSPEIISEMEEATGVSAQILKALCPGTDDIRDKLRLASGRKTTLVEDAAYSLLGVFSASLSIVYGEGDKALGRLLAHLLTSSGDTSILAWTGKSGPYNSCLPVKIGVFGQSATTHIPKAISDAEMDIITARLQSTSLNFSQAQKLYERLNDFPVPMFAGKRMRLPCIAFKLGPPVWNKSARVFRAQTTALGVVEIKTKEDLTRFDSLYLVHPWIDFLLHRHHVESGIETVSEGCMDDNASSISGVSLSPSLPSPPATIKRTRTMLAARMFGRSATLPQDTASLLPPVSVSEGSKRTRVLQFVARLRQPFGALLFTPTRQIVAEYRRVASESTITVQVQEDAHLSVLIENARMMDVL
ncbi:hypothetical protein EV363DRAFT_1295913 [Boletus edulis]|nr:hypothetical protein EV363DRAFT_1295913 [Boletus edulis]